MRPLLVASLLVAFACTEAAPPGPSADEVRAAIEAQNRAFGEAVHAGDAAAIGALYSADGAVFPPNAAKVTGRAAVAEFWASALTSGIASAVLTTEEVAYTGGDTATEIGSVVLSGKDGSVIDEGKYVVLWKQEDDAWRLHRDIWNSNRAPAPPSPEAEAPAEPAADAGPEPTAEPTTPQ
jgi:uncharacterized protein (TIGR02246 family)